MSNTISFIIDGREIQAEQGETILIAAEKAHIYIPRLCFMPELEAHGSCRVCTVLVNGRPQSACTQPVTPGIVVENNTEQLKKIRTKIIEMFFVEGNHFCMFCEKSGSCELQALAYRFGIFAPTLPYLYPHRETDATHPDIFIDRNRCILCGRCVSASKTFDGKGVFQFSGRGIHKRVTVNSAAGLSGTDLTATDKAAGICPVGAIVRKRTGYSVPIGKRPYDKNPIGADIEIRG